MLIGGWAVAVPVPLILIWAPSWGWIIAANVLLGISQGLTWATTVVMKIDLVGPAPRPGNGAERVVRLSCRCRNSFHHRLLAKAHGLRPAPFLLGVAYAALGLGMSVLFVRETREHARLEGARHVARVDDRHDHQRGDLTDGQVFAQTSFREPALSAASQAGLVNNLNDGLAWGLFPVLVASAGLSVARSACWRPSTLRCGAWVSSSPEPWSTGGGASGSSPAARDSRGWLWA